MFKKLYYPKRLRDRLNPQPEFKKRPAPVNALLWIDDTAYRLLEVSYGFTRHVDGAGRIIGDLCVTPIKAIIKPIKDHGSVALLAYASKRRFHGKIQHFHLDGINKIQKDTIIYNAYITSYEGTNSYYEPPFERVEVLTISPLYLKVNDTVYESSMNPNRPMEMNPPGLLSRADFEEEGSFKILTSYYETADGKRIKYLENGMVRLIIRSQNGIGKIVDLDLSDEEHDFLYQGKRLENDELIGLQLTGDLTSIVLEVIDQNSKNQKK